jgi:hypothetical protein
MMDAFLAGIGGWVYVIIFLGVLVSLGFLGDLKHRYTMLSFQLEEIKDTQSRILDLLFEIEERKDDGKNDAGRNKGFRNS